MPKQTATAEPEVTMTTPDPDPNQPVEPTAPVDPAQPTADPANPEATSPRPKAPRPTYGLEKMSGDLPDNAPTRQAGASNIYLETLSQITEPGEWYCIATFHTSGGAKSAKKAIEAGERKLPDGQWQFEARRVLPPGVNPDDKTTPRWSKLYARLVG